MVLLKNSMRWLGFTILGTPDLNSIVNTSIIVAGVVWSLPYEWLFYVALPLLGLTAGVRVPTPYLVFSFLGTIALLLLIHPQNRYLISFLGGIGASVIVKFERVREFAKTKKASLLVLGLLAFTVENYPSAYGFGSFIFLSLIFLLIAAGNNIFGLLVRPVSQALGTIAYSIYLLHGIILFIAFNFIIGLNNVKLFSSIDYWILIISLIPILIIISFLTFRFIENPTMQSTNAVTSWFRARLIFLNKYF